MRLLPKSCPIHDLELIISLALPQVVSYFKCQYETTQHDDIRIRDIVS